MRLRLLAVLLLAAIGGTAAPAPRSATVPMTLEHNRVLVELEFHRPDGTLRKARAWVDTGNQFFYMSEALARETGVDLSGPREKDEGIGGEKITAKPPPVSLAGLPLDTSDAPTYVIAGRNPIFPGLYADASLPATILKHYQVVLDYPARTFTMAEAGGTTFVGTRVDAKVNSKTGLIDMLATVADKPYSVALDCGASYGMFPESVVEEWSRKNPSWPRRNGAVGAANMWGIFPREAELRLLRVGQARWGAVRLEKIGVIGAPDQFAAWYSQKTAEPVTGLFGGNILKAFRVSIDYPGQAVFFHKGAAFEAHDLDMVPLTLAPTADGGFKVLGVASDHGKPLAEGIQAGDLLLQVSDLKTKGASMGAVVNALRGKPGEARRLFLQRDGKEIMAEPRVVRVW